MRASLAAGAIACIVVALLGCGGAANTTPLNGSTPAQTLSRASANVASETTTTASTPPAHPIRATPRSVPQPVIDQWPIPYGTTRKHEMAAYSLRHYGEDTYVLRNPKVIVEHYTETATAQEAFNTFAPDVPDSEFHELPNTCAHFRVEPDDRVDQLVPCPCRAVA